MASLDTILTAAQNLVQAVNTAAQIFLEVNGQKSTASISTPTYVESGPGRVCRVSITSAGTVSGYIYDAQSVSDLTRPLWLIPTTPGLIQVNIVTNYGILVVPGAGQVLSVGYS